VAEPRGFTRIAREAGLAPALVATIEGTGKALRPGDETDIKIIAASLMLEHHAIALYSHGLKQGLVPSHLRAYAVEFRGDHQGHRDTQVAIAEERGGEVPQPLAGYDFSSLPPGDDFLRAALAIEDAAQKAYTGLISSIRTRDYLLSAAFILVDEVRHQTVWRKVLGLKIY
jgi:hypothetical protein